MTYLSEKLDPVTAGCPACLHTMATITLLVKDADILALGQNLVISALHALESVVQRPDGWMTNTRMTHGQILLFNSDRVTFAHCKSKFSCPALRPRLLASSCQGTKVVGQTSH